LGSSLLPSGWMRTVDPSGACPPYSTFTVTGSLYVLTTNAA